ncbi:MAG: phosphoglycerate kinase [Elusimicrobiota bacterium]
MAVRPVQSVDLKGKRVLTRVDYNVPLEGGAISDDTRVRASLPTLNHLLSQGARVILISHLGRPKGQANPKYSLAPVAQHLGQLLKKPVAFAPDCVGPAAETAAKNLKDGEVLLLENLRFHPEEEKNDPAFARRLAALADFFVQDAFGAVHRAHASTDQAARLLPGAAGLLLQKELEFLGQVRERPAKPFMALVGGAKVSDKIDVLEKLLEKVDTLAIGGAMAYTFLAAQGFSTGKSLVEKDKVGLAKSLLEKARERGVRILLPRDHMVVSALEAESSARYTEDASIPEGWMGVDIGPGTIQDLAEPLGAAQSVFWNGPMGIFEVDRYARGTREAARLAAEAAQRGATVVIGGGDSVAAVQSAGLSEKITHISTGGGASLEFLEGKELPGVAALDARK